MERLRGKKHLAMGFLTTSRKAREVVTQQAFRPATSSLVSHGLRSSILRLLIMSHMAIPQLLYDTVTDLLISHVLPLFHVASRQHLLFPVLPYSSQTWRPVQYAHLRGEGRHGHRRW